MKEKRERNRCLRQVIVSCLHGFGKRTRELEQVSAREKTSVELPGSRLDAEEKSLVVISYRILSSIILHPFLVLKRNSC
jgi:hypothetical protein